MWPFWKFTFNADFLKFQMLKGRACTCWWRLKIRTGPSSGQNISSGRKWRHTLDCTHVMFACSRTWCSKTKELGSDCTCLIPCLNVLVQGTQQTHKEPETHRDSCTSTGIHTEGSSESTIQWKWSRALWPEPADAYLLWPLKASDRTQNLNIVMARQQMGCTSKNTMFFTFWTFKF